MHYNAIKFKGILIFLENFSHASLVRVPRRPEMEDSGPIWHIM